MVSSRTIGGIGLAVALVAAGAVAPRVNALPPGTPPSPGMFVAPGASARLRDSERSRFVTEEWPAVRERMKRLGIDPNRLLDQETA